MAGSAAQLVCSTSPIFHNTLSPSPRQGALCVCVCASLPHHPSSFLLSAIFRRARATHGACAQARVARWRHPTPSSAAVRQHSPYAVSFASLRLILFLASDSVLFLSLHALFSPLSLRSSSLPSLRPFVSPQLGSLSWPLYLLQLPPPRRPDQPMPLLGGAPDC